MKPQDKVKVLDDHANAQCDLDLCNKQNISNCMHSNIHQDELKDSQTADQLQMCTHVNLEQALLHWYRKVELRKDKISGSTLLLQAKRVAQQLEADFVPNRSWIQSWRKRHRINLRRLRHESASESATDMNLEIDLAALNAAEPELIECQVELTGYETDDEEQTNIDESPETPLNQPAKEGIYDQDEGNATATADKMLKTEKKKTNSSFQTQITHYFKKYC